MIGTLKYIDDELVKVPEIAASFCYVLMKPDVVLRNIVGDVFKYFEEIGFRLINYRCGQLPESLYSIMYEQSFLWKLDFWAHNARAYSFGPVIGVLFWNEGVVTSQYSAHEYLVLKKGAALPESLLPDTVRARFNSTSRVYNILHIPDDINKALIEACMWFGTSCVQALLTDQLNASTVKRLTTYSLLLKKEIDMHGYLVDRMLNGQASYALLKLRLLHAIKKQLRPCNRLVDMLSEFENHYYNFAQKLFEQSNSEQDKKEMLASVLQTERSYLQMLMADSFAPENSDMLTAGEAKKILQVILDLTFKERGTAITLEFFWHLIAKWRVYTSDLEKYVINTYFLYPTIL